LPAGVIGSCAANDGIALQNTTETKTGWTYQILIFFNDSFTFSTSERAVTGVMSINYPAGGYLNFPTYCSGGEYECGYAYQTFYSNGAACGPQTFFTTIISGPINIFADSDGAIWFGCTSNFSSRYTQIGIIGKVFSNNQNSNSSSQNQNTSNAIPVYGNIFFS
jgi:hypothetical protein